MIQQREQRMNCRTGYMPLGDMPNLLTGAGSQQKKAVPQHIGLVCKTTFRNNK